MSRLQDRSLLHPAFRERLLELDARLETARLPLRLYEGARTPWRQAELYARGRTIPGTKTVTKAMAWRSMHQFGLAADFVFYGDKGWTWDEPTNGGWEAYQEIAQALGLDILSFERPHIQYPWPLKDLTVGVYPPDGDKSWRAWLGQQCEQWGTFERDAGGLMHPAAPPPFDVEDRPALGVG